jgi:predicted kinase
LKNSKTTWHWRPRAPEFISKNAAFAVYKVRAACYTKGKFNGKGVDRMPTLVILMGLQGSGKSTFYETNLAQECVRVDADTPKTRHGEQLLLEDCLRRRRSIAIDGTNPTCAHRARYITPAKAAGYRIVGYFMESTLKECLARNALREDRSRVPDVAVAATCGRLELPTPDEGFDELYFVKSDGITVTAAPRRA